MAAAGINRRKLDPLIQNWFFVLMTLASVGMLAVADVTALLTVTALSA